MKNINFFERPLISLAVALLISCTSSASLAQNNVIDLTVPAEQITDRKPSVKRKIAIARFSNETRSGQSFLVDNSGDRLGKQAADILSARLVESGNFLLFERLDKNEVDAEKILSGMASEGVSVDYLIVGSISEFGRSTESQSGVFQRAMIQKAVSTVNVRLIDVTTGRIIFATEGTGEATSEAKTTLGVGSRAGYDDSLTDSAISAAISQVTSNLAENMTNKPWRSYLLAKEEGNYFMSGGESQGINPGMILYVYENGQTVKNPQTGALITLPGNKIGTISVLQSIGEDEFNEVSIVSLLSGEISKPLENYYIQEE